MKPLSIVFLSVAAIEIVLFVIWAAGSIAAPDVVPSLRPAGVSMQRHVVGGKELLDLFHLSAQKQRDREAADEYQTFRTLADRNKLEQERDTNWSKSATRSL